MTLAFKRMYVDIPADTHDRLKLRAVERGMSQKGLLADLIEQECAKPARKKAKTATKRKVKRKAKRKPTRRR